jgi:PTH1 family peptidyl-tRNA hydrolase
VVVGLGNPGLGYARTRHNIGFRVLDRLERELGAGREEDAGEYRVAWARVEGERVAFFRPMLFMNRSGLALSRFKEGETAGPDRHLVVQDDVWLPFGSLRFRKRGGAGGHNGLASVLRHLGTEAVPRLRLGVGGAEAEGDLAAHVLEPFTEEEEEAIESWLRKATEGVRVFLREGPDAAMNRFNG